VITSSKFDGLLLPFGESVPYLAEVIMTYITKTDRAMRQPKVVTISYKTEQESIQAYYHCDPMLGNAPFDESGDHEI
jgi:hypothetical protein